MGRQGACHWRKVQNKGGGWTKSVSLTEELDESHDDDDEVLHTDPVVAVSVALSLIHI